MSSREKLAAMLPVITDDLLEWWEQPVHMITHTGEHNAPTWSQDAVDFICLVAPNLLQRNAELEAEVALSNASLGMAWKTAYGRIDTIQDEHKARAEAAEAKLAAVGELPGKWVRVSPDSALFSMRICADELEALLK